VVSILPLLACIPVVHLATGAGAFHRQTLLGTGCVFIAAAFLIDALTVEVHRVAPRARIVRVSMEPVAGAVMLAYDVMGLAVTDAVVANLKATFPDASLFRTADVPTSEEGDRRPDRESLPTTRR
jgi:hypothetical protein